MKRTILPLLILLSGCAPLSVNQSAQATNEDLCANMAITGSQPARDELLRRKAVSLEELRLANAQQLEIGMRSLVVICSVGRPSEIQRNLGAEADELWIYHKFPIPLITAKNHRVSIKNGKVVAIQ